MYLKNMMDKSSDLKKIRILIVEDEGIIAEDMQDCLEGLGYTVLGITDTGEKAIKKVAEIHPDIVLMDIRLKGEMDGIEAAQYIWELFEIPVIYTTGHSDKSTLERAKVTAPFGYLLKPFEEKELYVAIETSLRRYQLEKQLKDREEWLNTIFRSIGDGVIVVDTQCRVKFLNPIAEYLTGWKQAEAVEKDLSQVFHIVSEKEKLPIDNPVKKVLQKGETLHLLPNTLLIAKNGSETPIDDSAAPLKNMNDDTVGCVLVFRDITERRQAEERTLALERAKQLEEQMRELQRINQLKDDFLSTVSHELRAPLANIKMAIEMLENVLDKQGKFSEIKASMSSPAIRYFQILREQCEQELNLVNDLLDLQRLNADAYPLNPTKIQLQNLIFVLKEAFEARVQKNEQSLKLNVPADLPTLMSDEPSLNRILRELINNACKYTPSGEQITITVYALPDDQPPSQINAIRVQITNTGIEIPAHELPHIFDKFYRVSGSDRWQHGGTGLGLTLVKKLVNYLGGSIGVESNTGQTCFTVELPLEMEQQ